PISLPPGDYDAIVRQTDSSAAYALPDPIEVPAGRETQVDVDLKRVEGRVQVLSANATGSVSNRRVAFVRVGMDLFEWPAVLTSTDAEGVAPRRAPPGAKVVRAAGPHSARHRSPPG